MGQWVVAAFAFYELLVGMSVEGACSGLVAGGEKGRSGIEMQSPEQGMLAMAGCWCPAHLRSTLVSCGGLGSPRQRVQVPFWVCWLLAGRLGTA